MNNLVYLSYGEGSHVYEIVFSILVAEGQMGAHGHHYRIIVYTDCPADFDGLPVQTEYLDADVLANWAGPLNFGHRRKICAIRAALEKYGDRVVFCDADTFFTRHPRKVFARIRPGQTVMHIGEYRLSDACADSLAGFFKTHDVLTLAGDRWPITPAAAMFNSGVIGLHESDILLLEEVMHLTDQIYPYVPRQTIEQFAFSICFAQRTKLRQAHDAVHHYWRRERRIPFDEELERVFGAGVVGSGEEPFRHLLSIRPCLTFRDRPFNSFVEQGLAPRLYANLWRAANRMGLLTRLRS